MKRILLPIAAATLLFASCSKDVSVAPSDAKLEIPYTSLSTASDYMTTFIDENATTTVDFSGQTTRLDMLSELDAYIKKGLTSPIMASTMKNMFENTNSPFATQALNEATSKVISSKTAQSFSATQADAERQRFVGYFTELERISQLHTQTAEQGKAGVLGGKRLVDENGFEYGQFVQKGLIGAMMLDQIVNIYLGDDKQAVDNTMNAEGKNYTAMEHHWDEAYGYLTSNGNYPLKGSERYLGEYARQGTSESNGASALFLSLITGRAAIVNNDMTVRDEQIANIRRDLERSIAVVAVSYLNKAAKATDPADKFHSLSEAVGFIYSLRYAHNPKINSVDSDELMKTLMGNKDGFWSLTNEYVLSVRNSIANAFVIEKSVEVNH